MYGKSLDWDCLETVRGLVGEIFADLRKDGFLARMNFSCCSNCGLYELEAMADERTEKGKKVQGAIFWHRQDEQRLQDGGPLCIRYFQVESDKHGLLGDFSTQEIGALIVSKLREKGIALDWDGNPNRTINVDATIWPIVKSA